MKAPKKTTVSLAAAMALAAALCLFGCASQPEAESQQAAPEQADAAPVFEETVSPNEDYVASPEDVVYYTVHVTQDASGMATVSTESNSGFFEPVSYQVECGQTLSADDVEVRWTTLMGGTEPSEDDQIAVADVSVQTADGTVDERKIVFVTGALEMIAKSTPIL